LNIYSEQHPPEDLGTNLKNDLRHQPLINRIKHAELWERALDGLRKDLETVLLPRGTLVDLAPIKNPHAPQGEIWNTINQCFCHMSECQATCTNVKPLLKSLWRRFCLEFQALEVLVQNITTHLAEKGFSSLENDWYQNRKEELSS